MNFFKMITSVLLFILISMDNTSAQSSNGDTWTKIIDSAAFSPRGENKVIVFKDKIWLIGGYLWSLDNPTTNLHDVWFTNDGRNWILATDQPGFYGGQAVLFQDKIWMIDAEKKTVWNSSDGKNWNHVATVDSFPEYSPRVVVFKNKIWLTGGADAFDLYLADGKLNPNRRVVWYNCVWSSADGIHWTKENTPSVFSKRSDHSLVVFNDKLWIIGGQSGPNLNDIWCSSDGINWVLAGYTPFSKRHVTQATVFDNKIWITGGFGNNESGYPVLLSDVWNSSDGIHWNEVTSSAPFGVRMEHQTVVYKDRLWIIAGQTGIFPNCKPLNDVWIMNP